MDPQAEKILSELVTFATEIGELLGTSPSNHGLLRGTGQMALAEAQNCVLLKEGQPLGSSLQSTANLAREMQSTTFTRAQINNSFNHFDQLRGHANGLVTRLKDMSVRLGRLGALSSDAARVARQGYQPIMSEAAQRIEVATKVETAIVEITNSGNANRLSGIVLTETGREEAFLVENQLARRGVQLLPNAVSNGRLLIQQIARFPINTDQAKTLLQDIATKGSMATTTAVSAARAAGPAARSWAATAAESIGTFLVAFGSRVISVPLIIGPMPGKEEGPRG